MHSVDRNGGQLVDFRVLGRLEVLANGQTLDLGPLRQRSLLALLVIHANEVVSTDRILEELWGEDASGKENALWVYVSRLRSALEPDRTDRGESTVLLRRDRGYVLDVDPEQIDAARFESLVADGRGLIGDDPEAASEILRKALELWRGPALEDFVYESFARDEISRLEELRLEALESRIEADLKRGQAQPLVSELESLVREHPLRERLIGQLMIVLYRSGRQAEALRVYQRARRRLADELGIEPSPELVRLEEQILLHDSAVAHPEQERTTTLTSAHNPYKGLLAFQEADSSSFYGRDSLVAEIVRKLGEGDRLVAAVGPSGSGKSSLVRAGVVPKLRKGSLPGSDLWQVVQMVPGSHPFAELEASMLRASLDPPDSLSEQLSGGDDGILRAVLRVLATDDGHLVLVIDQFEELFTLVDDPEVRQDFLNGLLVALDDPSGRFSLVLTLRADFYDRPLLHPEFGARLGPAVVNVTPLSTEELEEAATQPLIPTGVTLEPSLLAQLIADVVDQPGALPMFQYTLTELFDRRAGDVLRLDDYHNLGGVRGAITNRAEDLYQHLAPDEQEAAQQLFLRLVTLTDQDSVGRRRVPASEITSLDVDVVALQVVIEKFGAHRLLSFDRDRRTGAPTVEVGHEALLTEWERLGEWTQEARQDLIRHASLVTAVGEWESSGRDPDYLVRGTRLTEFENWAGSSRIELNARELEYLGAALQRRSEEQKAEEDRLAEEARLEGRARRRLWGLVAAVAGLVAIGLLYAAVALFTTDTRIALVNAVPPSDLGFRDLFYLGFDQAQLEHDFDAIERYPPFSDDEQVVRDLAESGTGLILLTDFDVRPDPEVIESYPETMFTYFDEAPPDEFANLSTYTFKVEQGAFLAGAAAALMSDTGKLGFIGGMQLTVVEPFRAGFEAGARYVKPDIEIEAMVLETQNPQLAFNSPHLARAAAEDLYDRGADVVLAAAGFSSFGIFPAARAKTEETEVKHWAIGVDSDMYHEVDVQDRPYVLTSALKKWDVAVQRAVAAFMDGTWEAGEHVLTLTDGGVDYSTSGDNLRPDVITKLDELKAGILSGEIAVPSLPTGPLHPPLGFETEAIQTLLIDADGQCSYGGYEGPEPTVPVDLEIRVDNQSAAPVTITRSFWWLDTPSGQETVSYHRFDGHWTNKPFVLQCAGEPIVPLFPTAVAGDDGRGPRALGEVTELPGEDRLDFLFELCDPECFRHAHFIDPNNSSMGSGPWTAGRSFHVRHGFVNESSTGLGEGFDVVLYVTRWGGPENEAFPLEQTFRFTADYMLRDTTDRCGPTYQTQTGPVTCDWFVHDFPDGLPHGRYDLWTVWEAPCSAWADLGHAPKCSDPAEVMPLFFSSVDSPFGDAPPSYKQPSGGPPVP